MQEWHRMDDGAPWKRNRPGPNPFKAGGNPFAGVVPGADDPFRIKPDIVHTFHIGFGADLCASVIVWLSMKGCFGLHPAFDDRLLAAYSAFQQFCHNTSRYTSCDEWSKSNLGMSKLLGKSSGFTVLSHLMEHLHTHRHPNHPPRLDSFPT